MDLSHLMLWVGVISLGFWKKKESKSKLVKVVIAHSILPNKLDLS